MLDQFHPCIHDSIENIVDIKADGNYGYRAIDALLDMGEDSWSLVRDGSLPLEIIVAVSFMRRNVVVIVFVLI